MSDLSARIRVIAIGRDGGAGGLEHPPRRDTRLAAADDAYLAGPYEELLEVLKRERQGGAEPGVSSRARCSDRPADVRHLLERGHVLVVERDVAGGHVLLQMRDRGRPRDQQHPVVVGQQPCERDLRRQRRRAWQPPGRSPDPAPAWRGRR